MAQLNTATVIGPARSFSNQLLASLPPALQQALAPSLATVHVEVKQMFHHQGEPVTDVYFPNDGVASITTMLADGATVEAATVGDEGMLGFEASPWSLRIQRAPPGQSVVRGRPKDTGAFPPRACIRGYDQDAITTTVAKGVI